MLFRSVTEKSIKIVEKYGYKEIIPNILENLDLFVRPLGETSDIIAKEVLTKIVMKRC